MEKLKYFIQMVQNLCKFYSYFRGRYEQGMRILGQFDFNNGYFYEGGFLGEKFHGTGQLTIPSGKVFYGEWDENSLVGKV